jgi:hypothetical protein
MPAYLLEPASTTDYTTAISNITTELNDIDTDTTSMAVQIVAIATALVTLATNSTTLATNSTTLATNSTTIATKLTAIETYQKKLKELGETTGIHVVGPYDWLGLINVYRSLIEQGGIADTQGNVSSAKQAEAIALVNAYIARIQAFPTGF